MASRRWSGARAFTGAATEPLAAAARPLTGSCLSDLRPTTRELADKAVTRLRARGPAEVATIAAGRIRKELFSSDRLLFLSRRASGPFPEREGVELRYARGSDAWRYARDIGTDSQRTFAARLSPTTGCFLALDGDRILHASWVTEAAAWTAELKRYVRPPPGDAYVYESFTRPDARGQGLYPLALAAISAEAAAHSLRRVWVGVEDANVPSLRAVTKAGFEAALTVLYRHRLGRVTVDVTPIPGGGNGPLLQICPPGTDPSVSAVIVGGAAEESKP